MLRFLVDGAKELSLNARHLRDFDQLRRGQGIVVRRRLVSCRVAWTGGGVNVNRSGGKLVISDIGCEETTPNRDISSKGEAPRMLKLSSVSVGGEPKLEMDESVQ